MYNIMEKAIGCIKSVYIGFLEVLEPIISMVFEILKRLDCEDRTTIYVAATGLLVAIVIFIAEIVSNKKYETYKRVTLKSTNIIQNVIDMVIVLLMIWFVNILEIRNTWLYIIMQLFINFLIIYSAFKTLIVFIIAIKLNTSGKYLNEQLEKYIDDEIIDFEKNVEKNKLKEKKETKIFEKYVNDFKLFSINKYFYDSKKEYTEIYPNNSGFIEKYDYNILNWIANNAKTIVTFEGDLKESNIINGKFSIPEIIFCKTIGDKTSKNEPIAYYKNVSPNLINALRKCITISKEAISDNISIIIDDLFKMAKEENKSEFDVNDRLYNLYESLCLEDKSDVRAMFMLKLEEYYYIVRNESQYNLEFIEFLVRLLRISFKYNKTEEFKVINNYMTLLHYARMKEEKIDFKQLAYDYARNEHNLGFYSIKKSTEYRFIDNILANILIMINGFVRHRQIDAIKVIFDNMNFDTVSHIKGDKLSEINVIKFQFLIGMINILLYSKDILTAEDIKQFKKIIKTIEHNFLGFYDIWETIVNYRKHIQTKSDIIKIIGDLHFLNGKEKYKSSWAYYSIDPCEVLKYIIYIFNINFAKLEDISKDDIERTDKYDFNMLLNMLEKPTHDKLEEALDFKKYDTSTLKEVLNKAISICKEKEIEYNRTAILEPSKKQKFERIIKSKSKEHTEILEYIVNSNRIQQSNEKIKKVFGISTLIPRELFFKDSGGFEAIAEDYGQAFSRGMNKEIVKVIESYSSNTEESLQKVLINKAPKDYILIMNYNKYNMLSNKKGENNIWINDNAYYVIKTSLVNNIILINKNSLPKIERCKFDDNYDIQNIEDGIYYKLEDCSGNTKLINEIIEKSEWIKEKGNEDAQKVFLEQQCSLRVFISYRILEPKLKDSIIITTDFY